MANKAIVHIDLLGVQKMWGEGGASAVKGRIEEFNEFILRQFNYLPPELHRDGEYTVILSGDSVSVMCQDFDQVIGIATHLFVQAFYDTDKRKQPFWLRGAISTWQNQHLTANTVPIHSKSIQIGTRYVTEDDYLAVLALEKSGFKGMRLIIDRRLLKDYGRIYQFSWEGYKKSIGSIATLTECTYPHGEHYADVLWMIESKHRFEQLKGIMASRFKKSTGNPEEFSQASWTRAVFDQVESLAWGCR